ncbi:hypothetical protein KP509_07G058900 [Ceratopteris richardii]|uniref:Uncharacterized protein n=1 Tax=Ceratopteris richardii TaxID=49495 RepID=A0A8T2UB93_CERRI|nr:hypothetical protein KP509_07G058900 [Ceratopteris richardii]
MNPPVTTILPLQFLFCWAHVEMVGKVEEAATFNHAIAWIKSKHYPTFTFDCHPFPVISQNYKTSGCISNDDDLFHRARTFFMLYREHEVHLPASVGGESSQEKIWDNGAHTALATSSGHACERTTSVTTSHSLWQNNCMNLNYTNSSRGDSLCRVHACHKFNQDLICSSSYAESSSGDQTLDIELQQEKKHYKMTGRFMKSLPNGVHHLHMQSSVSLPAAVTLQNSISTDFEQGGSSDVEVAWASNHSSWLSRLCVGIDGHKEVTFRSTQKFWKAIEAGVTASSDFSQNRFS